MIKALLPIILVQFGSIKTDTETFHCAMEGSPSVEFVLKLMPNLGSAAVTHKDGRVEVLDMRKTDGTLVFENRSVRYDFYPATLAISKTGVRPVSFAKGSCTKT